MTNLVKVVALFVNLARFFKLLKLKKDVGNLEIAPQVFGQVYRSIELSKDALG